MELFQEILPTVHPRRQQHQQIRLIRSLTFSSIKSPVASSPFFFFFSPFRGSRRQELNCRALVELESNRKIPPFSNFPTLEPKKRRGWVLLLLSVEAQIREEEASEVLQLKIEKAPKILFSISESWKLGDKNGMFAMGL